MIKEQSDWPPLRRKVDWVPSGDANLMTSKALGSGDPDKLRAPKIYGELVEPLKRAPRHA